MARGEWSDSRTGADARVTWAKADRERRPPVPVPPGFPTARERSAPRRLRTVPPKAEPVWVEPGRSERFVVASFARERDLLDAVRELRANQFAIADVFTPYAVHGLEEAADFAPTRIGWVCAVAGFAGAGAMLLFEWWSSAASWAIDVGGKPFNSLPAFVPPMFEIGVLSAGLTTVLAFFVRSRLYPGRMPVMPACGVTDDRFAIVLEERDSSFDEDLAEEICRRHGAVEIAERFEGGSGR